LRREDAGRADDLQPDRNVGNVKPDGVEPHDRDPSDEEHEQADHEDAVPSRLLALHRRRHALLQQRGIMDIKPSADDGAGNAELDQERPGLRPPDGSSWHEQQRRHHEEPDHGPGDESGEHCAPPGVRRICTLRARAIQRPPQL
jgi:hypothetical protein